MLTTRVPTILLSSAPRWSVLRLQDQLAKAQVELASQRIADVGLELGAKTSVLLDLTWQLSSLENDAGRIDQARNRAETTQSTLQGLSDLAGTFLNTLTGARGAILGRDIARDAAKDALSAMASLLNTSFAGGYVFGGLNSRTAPMGDHDGSAGQQAVADAFLDHFGFTMTDAAVADITAAELDDFASGAFADLFSAGSWPELWTTAAAENSRTDIGGGQSIDVGANATAPFVAKLTQAFALIADLGEGQFGHDVFVKLADMAISLIATAQDSITREQGRIGIGQQRLLAVSDDIASRRIPVRKAIEALEGVDAYELAERINAMTTQLEASYAITGRLSRLSLLSYI